MRWTAGAGGLLVLALSLACAGATGTIFDYPAEDREDPNGSGRGRAGPGVTSIPETTDPDQDTEADARTDGGIPSGRTPPVPPPLDEIHPVLTLATANLADESFETDSWKRVFRFYKADATVIGGELRFGAVPGAGHPPQGILRLRGPDFAMQFRFRLEGSASLAVQTSDDKLRTHVANVSVGTRGINLNRMTGWGGTTKYIRLTRSDLNMEKGRTYTLLVEMQGDEMAVHLDGRCLVYAQAPGLEANKNVVYLTGGGTYTFYDDVRVWQTEANPEWPARREATLADRQDCP